MYSLLGLPGMQLTEIIARRIFCVLHHLGLRVIIY
jgi:hypothetical protein